MKSKVEQLLTVWNPYYQPETIQVHVELLRKHGAVWWGRLYRGRTLDKDAAKKRFPAAWDVVRQVREEGRELLVFTTNHVLLHALRVDEVRFGHELPEEERALVPSYYEDAKAPAALWFRVRDVRALAFSQIDTLRYFFDSGELEAGLTGYDPFAAYEWVYPIAVRGPSVEEIFDPAHLRGKARAFADHPETLFPPEVDLARRELHRMLGGLWPRLEEKSQHFLASGWVVYGRYQGLRDFDLSSAFSGVARAVEAELCEATVGPLLERLDLREALLGARPLTLGVVERALDEVAEAAVAHGVETLGALVDDRQWRRWLRRFVSLRNDAAHPKQVRRSKIVRAWEEVVAEESMLRPLVEAKHAVRAATALHAGAAT